MGWWTWNPEAAGRAAEPSPGLTVSMTLEQAKHVRAWLKASTMDMRRDDPGLWESWLRMPVGQFWKVLNQLVGEAS